MTARVVRIEGSLDMTNVEEYVRQVLEASDGCQVVRLDLAGLDFIDSTGVGGLVRLAQALPARGCRLEVAGVHPEVREILDVMGVSQILPLV